MLILSSFRKLRLTHSPLPHTSAITLSTSPSASKRYDNLQCGLTITGDGTAPDILNNQVEANRGEAGVSINSQANPHVDRNRVRACNVGLLFNKYVFMLLVFNEYTLIIIKFMYYKNKCGKFDLIICFLI